MILTDGKRCTCITVSNTWLSELSSIAAVPAFPGLRRFPEGRNFKQWTGNDSKALMKVVLFVLSRLPAKLLTILIGLSSGDCGTCTRSNCSSYSCIPGLLLHSASRIAR